MTTQGNSEFQGIKGTILLKIHLSCFFKENLDCINIKLCLEYAKKHFTVVNMKHLQVHLGLLLCVQAMPLFC